MNTTKGARRLTAATTRTLAAAGFDVVGTAAQRGRIWIVRRPAGGWIVTDRDRTVTVDGAVRPFAGMKAANIAEALRLADAAERVADVVKAPEERPDELVAYDDVVHPAGGPSRPCRAGEEPCIACGRPVNVRRPYHAAHLLTTGFFAAFGADHEDSQGWHAIGPDCARRLPATHTGILDPLPA
jgi:hypothetical protein